MAPAAAADAPPAGTGAPGPAAPLEPEAPVVGEKAPTETYVADPALPSSGVGTATGLGAGADVQILPARDAGTPGSAAGGPEVNPLAGDTFYGPNGEAAAAAARLQASDPAGAALLAELAGVPSATWLGAWSGDVASAVRQRVEAARAAGAVPVFVAYNAPGRDCGGHSAGGVSSPAAYAAWVQGIADGIGSAEAVVIVEPDTLALLCGDPAERYRMLASAVDVLEGNSGTRTYLDAGHSNWIGPQEMSQRLRAAGVDRADGFALNVSNFETTADNVAYGNALSTELGGARFVVDTSRNGNGAGTDWCNPSGRAMGERPTSSTGHPLVDAYLWVKTPGESDGTCNGGPQAGVFWPEYALALARG
ncbi:glycoside hydrolase family 6 protein [Blastococcus sp. HT6-30]|uniref:glycoside hydrolase family 6 protein n=1 Tax=Blastococcus sp. HT6-30 TaxID=3144843 RepID=UPI00321BB4FE